MGSGIAHLETGSVNTSVDMVWQSCFVPMKWEAWVRSREKISIAFDRKKIINHISQTRTGSRCKGNDKRKWSSSSWHNIYIPDERREVV